MAEQGVTDKPDKMRFELEVDGHTAFAQYRRSGDRIVLTHTEVPRELAGRGIGSQLASGVFDSFVAPAERPSRNAPLWPHTSPSMRICRTWSRVDRRLGLIECGRVVQASGPDQLGLHIVGSFQGRDGRTPSNYPRLFNVAPSQGL